MDAALGRAPGGACPGAACRGNHPACYSVAKGGRGRITRNESHVKNAVLHNRCQSKYVACQVLAAELSRRWPIWRALAGMKSARRFVAALIASVRAANGIMELPEEWHRRGTGTSQRRKVTVKGTAGPGRAGL